MYGNETFCLPCPIGQTTSDGTATSFERCAGKTQLLPVQESDIITGIKLAVMEMMTVIMMMIIITMMMIGMMVVVIMTML